jgi:predicted metalloprotease with PDZ domain
MRPKFCSEIKNIMSFPATKIIVLLCLLLGFTNLAIANTYDSIEYNLNLINIKDSVLKVEIVLRGKFKDKLVLDLPFKWAGTTYIDQIKNIEVNPKSWVELKQENNNSQAIISIPKTSNDSVKITYEIHQKAGNPSNVHEAIVRDDLVHAPGYGIFATPYGLNESDKINVTIKWVNLDSKWKTISSYGAKSNISLNITPPELLHAIYVAGKIRMYNVSTDSQPIILSLYGRFDIEDQRITSDLKEIINSQRAFFNDFDFPYYTISLIEGDDLRSMGGTRLLGSFTAFLPRGMNKNDYYILFAHEHLHNWIGGKIRNNKEEELNYWWTEGFTDFYSRLIALRSKGIDRKTFIDEMNQFLRAYYLSPVNQEPNLRIQKDFWNDYDIEKLPYYRGLVFTLYLNNLLQKEIPDTSLDTIMHDLFKVAHEQKFSSSLFKDIVHKYIKNGIENEMMNFIEKGNIISLEGINLPIEKVSMGRYYLGFNRDILIKDQSIQEIDIKSNAYKAGLRNGQKVIAWDCPKGKGDPDQIITIKTSDGTFKFKPEHSSKIEIYQLKTDLLAQEEKQFNKFFGIK